MRQILYLATVVTVAGAAEPYPQFWKQWGDGQAEIAAYDLVASRYGKPRPGTAVTIFVTEPFSKSTRVKADPGRHPASDETPVIKLNLVKDYPTGIYDYNEMWSVFADVGSGRLLKTSFSRQEWCGHVYKQLLWDAARIRTALHSYFDGEADQAGELAIPAGAANGGSLSEDALLLWARGITEPRLAVGESRNVPFLNGLGTKGMPAWKTATITRQEQPGGLERWSAKTAGGTWCVIRETTGERRILSWESPGGEKGTLIRSARLKYWEMNSPEFQAELKKLGLRARPPRAM